MCKLNKITLGNSIYEVLISAFAAVLLKNFFFKKIIFSRRKQQQSEVKKVLSGLLCVDGLNSSSSSRSELLPGGHQGCAEGLRGPLDSAGPGPHPAAPQGHRLRGRPRGGAWSVGGLLLQLGSRPQASAGPRGEPAGAVRLAAECSTSLPLPPDPGPVAQSVCEAGRPAQLLQPAGKTS